jgi:2,4-dienoyl-CoA reductase (NADPH2)
VIREGDGAERSIGADTVVIAAGQEPETALARLLAGAGRPHIVIGGAAGAAELDAERAFREGARTPLAVAQLLR